MMTVNLIIGPPVSKRAGYKEARGQADGGRQKARTDSMSVASKKVGMQRFFPQATSPLHTFYLAHMRTQNAASGTI
jgi:hypothetical protein